MRTVLRSRERPIGNRTSDPTVAIVERRNGDKPQMGNSRLEHSIERLLAVEPRKKSAHLLLQSADLRRLKVNSLSSNSSSDNLHRPAAIIGPILHTNFGHSA